MPTAYGALGYQVGWITVAAIIEAAQNQAIDGTTVRDALPGASTSDLVREHGILDLELTQDGTAVSRGVMATFAPGGTMVIAGSAG